MEIEAVDLLLPSSPSSSLVATGMCSGSRKGWCFRRGAAAGEAEEEAHTCVQNL